MPTYVYQCKDCGHGFEKVQSFSDDALTVCPECQGHLRKVFTPVGVAFKGSGFYRTDSRGGASSSTPASQSSSAASSNTSKGGSESSASSTGTSNGTKTAKTSEKSSSAGSSSSTSA